MGTLTKGFICYFAAGVSSAIFTPNSGQVLLQNVTIAFWLKQRNLVDTWPSFSSQITPLFE